MGRNITEITKLEQSCDSEREKGTLADLQADREQAIRFANRVSTEITPDWLRERCSLGAYLQDFTPSDVLSELYEPGEYVPVFTDARSQGRLWR